MIEIFLIKKLIKLIPYSTLSSLPPNDCHFAKLGGGLDKGDFYFSKFTLNI